MSAGRSLFQRCRDGHPEILFSGLLDSCPVCDYRKRLDEIAAPPAPPLALGTQPLTETHGWPQIPAPPVATTGAVPTKDIEAGIIALHAMSLHGVADRLRSWLSAAPAPKASEGEERRTPHGRVDYFLDELVREAKSATGSPAVKERLDEMAEEIRRAMHPLAQPHARAEGASESVRGILDSIIVYGLDTLSGREDGPDSREWYREGVQVMVDRAKALRRALSGSAEGRT